MSDRWKIRVLGALLAAALLAELAMLWRRAPSAPALVAPLLVAALAIVALGRAVREGAARRARERDARLAEHLRATRALRGPETAAGSNEEGARG